MLPKLSTILNYQHEKVIRSYIRTYEVNVDQANKLFSEMLKYLWISRKHALNRKQEPNNAELDFQFVMHEEMRDMDNMWHNFILYTKDYTAFCNHYFGEYLHHEPDIAEAITQTNDEFSLELAKYLTYVYDHLGEETVRDWFKPYCSDQNDS